jgi:hypothetical protein
LHLQDDKEPLVAAVAKFSKLTPKIEAYVEAIDKSTTKWGKNIEDDMKRILDFCKMLKGRSFGSSLLNI